MPYLGNEFEVAYLAFMQEAFVQLPNDLNATVGVDNEELEMVVWEADALWSSGGNEKNQPWLWLGMHSKRQQIVAFHVGDRSKASGQALMAKLPEDLEKSRLLHRLLHNLGRNYPLHPPPPHR